MLIKVKVFPDSKKDEIIKKKEDSFEIKVKERPIEGKANKKALQLLSIYLKVSEKKIRMVRGSKKRNKIFEIF